MFQPTINPFSKYTDRFEKKVDSLFKKIIFLGRPEAQKRLLDLMQYNLVITDIWLEKEFKGYKYLKKSNRRRLYQNTQIIVEKFEQFCATSQIDEMQVKNILAGYRLQYSPENFKKIIYLAQIMAFLRPGKFYEYLEGASFGKLLVNIDKEKMIGDCNQIVTFYTFLYSLHFSIADLKIKILPGHVCLHFQGIDIEATNATFQQYEKFEYVLDITELIPTNLLDISDFRDKQILIDKRTVLKGAELAFSTSSMRELVEKNLQITYQNLAIESAQQKDFDTARFFLEKLNDPLLKKQIFYNAILYYCEHRDFVKAKSYAEKLMQVDYAKGDEMKKYSIEQEGLYCFNNDKITQALNLFKTSGNQQMIKACYAKEFNQIQARVSLLKTTAEIKNHKAEYYRMIDLARLMDDQTLAEKIRVFLDSVR